MLKVNLKPQFQNIYEEIISRLKSKKIDAAKDVLENFLDITKAIKADISEFIIAFNNLGNEFYQSEAFGEAEQCYRAAIPLATENKGLILLHCFIINCLLYQERIEDAKAILPVALELVKAIQAPNAQCMENFKIIGEMFYDRNAFIEAEQCYKWAIFLAPTKSKINLGVIHNEIANSISMRLENRAQEIENHYFEALKFAIENKEEARIIRVLEDLSRHRLNYFEETSSIKAIYSFFTIPKNKLPEIFELLSKECKIAINNTKMITIQCFALVYDYINSLCIQKCDLTSESNTIKKWVKWFNTGEKNCIGRFNLIYTELKDKLMGLQQPEPMSIKERELSLQVEFLTKKVEELENRVPKRSADEITSLEANENLPDRKRQRTLDEHGFFTKKEVQSRDIINKSTCLKQIKL